MATGRGRTDVSGGEIQPSSGSYQNRKGLEIPVSEAHLQRWILGISAARKQAPKSLVYKCSSSSSFIWKRNGLEWALAN